MKRDVIVQCKNCEKKWRIKEKKEGEFVGPQTLDCPQCNSVYRTVSIDDIMVKEYVPGAQEARVFDVELIPHYFSVSKKKLIIMSVCTFGIYELYWFYKNWQLVKNGTSKKIHPLGRAIFALFFCPSLFKTIERSARACGVPVTHKINSLVVLYIVFLVSNNLPEPLSLAAFFTFIPLMTIQNYCNAINQIKKSDLPCNDTFSRKNILVIVLGAIVLVLSLIGSFMPKQINA